MFSVGLRSNVFTNNITKTLFYVTKRNFKVMIAGAAGGVGQPLSLLLKQNPLVSHLCLYDVASVTKGVAIDLSHMDTKTKVSGHCGPEEMIEALKDTDLIIMLAGVPNRDPGSPTEFLFDTNAPIVSGITTYIAAIAPDAIIAVVTDPIDSMVPIVSEIMKRNGAYNPSKILGVTTLDVIRTATFVSEVNSVNPTLVEVSVIGGNSQNTIIPLLSQCRPAVNSDEPWLKKLTTKVNNASAYVARAKIPAGSATLSMAFAAARFTNSILKGLMGIDNIIECAYVKSTLTPSPYFASPIKFGMHGVERNLGYGKLSSFEEKLLTVAVPMIWQSARKGENYVRKLDSKDKLH